MKKSFAIDAGTIGLLLGHLEAYIEDDQKLRTSDAELLVHCIKTDIGPHLYEQITQKTDDAKKGL